MVRYAAIALLGLAACAGRADPSETTCYLEPSLTPEVAQAVLDSVQVWESTTDRGFQCASVVYGVRPESADGTIAFRVAPSLGEPGLESLADTARVLGHINALITIAPETFAPGSTVRLQTVINHEIGHALGLNHVDGTDPSVMFIFYPDDSPVPTGRDVYAFGNEWWTKR